MKTLVVPARREQLDTVNAFLEESLEALDCSPRSMMQILLAAEEIFVNIASYSGAKTAEIRVEAGGDPPSATISFSDAGAPFDPLAKPDADTTLPVSERSIGGLGILLVKKTMDAVTYSREDGKNILTIRKLLPAEGSL